MPLIKILLAPIYFLRALIFDREEEYTFTHHEFNIRKYLAFLLLCLSILLNLILIYKSAQLVIDVVKLESEVEILEAKLRIANQRQSTESSQEIHVP